MTDPKPTRPEDLLRHREARSLVWSIRARMLLLAAPILVGALQILGVFDAGLAESDAQALLATLLAVGAFLLLLRGLRLAQQERRLPLVGHGIVALDIAFLALLPVIWVKTNPDPEALRAFLLKNELFTVSIVLIGINALSLSPRYPAIMTGGAIAVHLATLLYVQQDPRVQWTDSFEEHFTSASVNLGVLHGRLAAMAMLGGVMWFVARRARELVRDAVALEAANQQMRERQAQLVAEGRMTAMASLVAGIAHELNSPLGAAQSSLQTAQRCGEKLAGEASAEERRRVLDALRRSADAGRAAIERLSGLLGSLKAFAQLDQAEVQRVDLRDNLKATLSLIDEALKGQVEIHTAFDELPTLLCRPKEINQVLRTIVINALEALGGRGELRVRARRVGERVELEFADNGPGIDPDRLQRLFEFGLDQKGERVGMGLGLITGKRVIERHGGELIVRSVPGSGTTFTVSLPCRTMLEAGA